MMTYSSASSKQGSALLVTILVSSLMLLLVLAFAAQVRLELREVAMRQDLFLAKANRPAGLGSGDRPASGKRWS